MPLCTFAFWTQGSSGHFELVIYGYFFINLFTAYNSGTVKKFMNVYETPPFLTIWPWTMNQKWLRLTVRYYWHLLCALLNEIRFFWNGLQHYTLIQAAKFSAKTVLMAKLLQNNSNLNDFEFSRHVKARKIEKRAKKFLKAKGRPNEGQR